MRVRFSTKAQADLRAAFDYIVADSLKAARDVVDRIMSAIYSLPEAPFKGRPGREDGTRELVVSRTSYVAIYRVTDDEMYPSGDGRLAQVG